MDTSHLESVNDDIPTILVMIKSVADNISAGYVESSSESESRGRRFAGISKAVLSVHDALVKTTVVVSLALHDFRLVHARVLLDEELGFWVLPRSTAWFSQFLLHEYEDKRWVELFRFNKAAIFNLARVLSRHCERMNTKYRKAIPIRV
jgi:hypothetical protein